MKHTPATADGERCLVCGKAVERMTRQGKPYLRHRQARRGPDIVYGKRTRDPNAPPTRRWDEYR